MAAEIAAGQARALGGAAGALAAGGGGPLLLSSVSPLRFPWHGPPRVMVAVAGPLSLQPAAPPASPASPPTDGPGKLTAGAAAKGTGVFCYIVWCSIFL